MLNLYKKIQQCTLCQQTLPLSPKPILQISENSKILIAGQAPGIKAHNAAKAFTDQSGERLRRWLGVDVHQFYQPDNFAILPMGFCYPGKGKSGDSAPLPQCAQTWRKPLLASLKQVGLTIILGKYAANWHLQSTASISALAQQWQYLLKHDQIVLPHPSPRNNAWLQRNPWFEQEVIPNLQDKVKSLLAV